MSTKIGETSESGVNLVGFSDPMEPRFSGLDQRVDQLNQDTRALRGFRIGDTWANRINSCGKASFITIGVTASVYLAQAILLHK